MCSIKPTSFLKSFAYLSACYQAAIKPTLLLALAALCLWKVAVADEASERELQIEAAYLFHFTQFTEWPNAASVIHYCVYEDANFTELLQKTYTNKTIGGISLDVENINAQTPLDNCHIIYFPKTVAADYLEKIHKLAILSVGMQKDFAKSGGIIYLFEEDQKLRFYINNVAATEVGLKISSQLLKLSKEP